MATSININLKDVGSVRSKFQNMKIAKRNLHKLPLINSCKNTEIYCMRIIQKLLLNALVLELTFFCLFFGKTDKFIS